MSCVPGYDTTATQYYKCTGEYHKGCFACDQDTLPNGQRCSAMIPVDAWAQVLSTATSLGTGIVLLGSIYGQYKKLSKDAESSQVRRWKDGIFYSLSDAERPVQPISSGRKCTIIAAMLLTLLCGALNIAMLHKLWSAHSVTEQCYREVFDEGGGLSGWFYVQKVAEALFSIAQATELLGTLVYTVCRDSWNESRNNVVHPSIEVEKVDNSVDKQSAPPQYSSKFDPIAPESNNVEMALNIIADIQQTNSTMTETQSPAQPIGPLFKPLHSPAS